MAAVTTKDVLLANLDWAFDRSAWHGTTLKGSLRGLKPEVACWQPGPERNSIWQLLLHAAYWKYIARRRLAGSDEPEFPRSPSNFPSPPKGGTATDLKRDIRLLTDEHAMLRTSVEAFPVTRLDERFGKAGPTAAGLILGVAAHDLYHTGQIQLLKRLHAER